jgi:endoglucanase
MGVRMREIIIGLCVLVACSIPATGQEPGSAGETPAVTHVGMAAPDIVEVMIVEGRRVPGDVLPYVRQEGDRITDPEHHRFVIRDGEEIGNLVGPRNDKIRLLDRIVGQHLTAAWLGDPASYVLTRGREGAAQGEITPAQVWRKSRPIDMCRRPGWKFEPVMQHHVYLKLAQALPAGEEYVLAFRGSELKPQSFKMDYRSLRSESVHVSQTGFSPHDPAKVAFLSTWLGDGGAYHYPDGTTFEVVNDEGRVVRTGLIALSKAADDRTEDAYHNNSHGTDVYVMDFSDLDEPGTYRIAVPGVGCSYPFAISARAWWDAFYVSARGFYHQRSGIALGPPHTDFVRPRSFHPDDGVVVYQSTTPLMRTGNGGFAGDTSNFGNLVAGKTDQVVEGAWGGYMDAGDWDRRIQHLRVARLLLELAEMYPDDFGAFSLNIPESGDGLPDVVSEALWGLGIYRRMQTPDGGIRGGVESSEHPAEGDTSWTESLTVMAYAPGVWSSHVYAGVAARAAFWLERHRPNYPNPWRESAMRAMEWAEKHWGDLDLKEYGHQVQDDRNLAAAELFRLTGEARWNELFLSTTKFQDEKAPVWEWDSHDMRDAAWVYANTDRPGVDPGVKGNCVRALVREADERVEQEAKTGFKWTSHPWAPAGWGSLTAPDAETLVRAHALTGDERYLKAAILACQTGLGANPLNLCYTTGLGANSPQNPLHIDSRRTGQPPPPGLTVFGPMDPVRTKDEWAQKICAQWVYPEMTAWPAIEAYWDVFMHPMMCEFTVQTPMAVNAYVWGYLAAVSSHR